MRPLSIEQGRNPTMFDRIIKRRDHCGQYDEAVFQIGNGIYEAKVHGDDVWDLRRRFKSAPPRPLTPREQFRVATAIKTLLGNEELAAMNDEAR